MITCNICGKPNPADMADCQYCGASLAGQSSGNRRMNAQEQIPAWLESLKASERPAPPAGGQPDFSLADLVDQDALPGWMRPDSAELAGNSDSHKYPALRPASMSGPNTDSGSVGRITPGSLSAGSLIDSSSLPSWMQPAQTSQPNAISAGSLVEPDSLPGWLTGQSSPQPSLSPSQPQMSPYSQQPQPSQIPQPLAQGFPTSTPTPRANSINPAIWQGPANPAQESTVQPGSGIAASSLLDVNSLPQWMRENTQYGQQGHQSLQGQYGQSGPGSGSLLSAGSLIDMNSLPEWLRAAEQGTQGGYAPPASSSPFGGSGVYGTPGVQGTSPRVESMRVPSRPRPEMAPLEQSEVAANVFSSMLGVASVSPSYPSAPASEYAPAQQSFRAMSPPSPLVQGQFPSPAVPSFIQQGQQGVPAGVPSYQPSASPPAYTAMPPATPAQGIMPNAFGGRQPAAQQAGYYGPTNGPVPMSPNAFQGLPASEQVQMAGTAGSKTARRGFLETIRGWFHQ